MSEYQKDHKNVGAYYDQEVLSKAEATGAGLIWFMGRDHLSPSLSNEDEFALHSERWREAISKRVLDLARRMEITEGNKVLELGCGIGGPGRDIADALHAQVVGISISAKQLENLRRISKEVNSSYMAVVKGDMQKLPFADESLDNVYSINAVYHVNDPRAVISESARVLKPGGKFGVDDWFVTDDVSPEEHEALRYNWSTSSNGFHNFDRFAESMEEEALRVVDIVDYTEEAGMFLSEDRFGVTYDTQIAPVLLDAFPQLYRYEGYEPAHAEMAVAQLRDNVLYMGELYRTGKAVYRQVIAEKI